MSRPESVWVTVPAPTAPADAPKPPESVSFTENLEAVAPLLALVGTDAMSIFAEGFCVTSDSISFVSAVPIPDVEPIPVGEDEAAQWGWPVTVRVDRP